MWNIVLYFKDSQNVQKTIYAGSHQHWIKYSITGDELFKASDELLDISIQVNYQVSTISEVFLYVCY